MRNKKEEYNYQDTINEMQGMMLGRQMMEGSIHRLNR
jgi:hypothetical protein